MPEVSATTPCRTAEICSHILNANDGRREGLLPDPSPELATGELMKRFLDFLPDLQLYVIASMGVALVFEVIRGLL